MRWHRRLFGVAFLLVCYALVGLAFGMLDPAVAINVLVVGVLGCVYFYLRARQGRPPTPPRNVRIHHPDGTTVPVELVYSGQEQGIHVWTMVLPDSISLNDLRGMSLSADTLPARTAIHLPVRRA